MSLKLPVLGSIFLSIPKLNGQGPHSTCTSPRFPRIPKALLTLTPQLPSLFPWEFQDLPDISLPGVVSLLPPLQPLQCVTQLPSFDFSQSNPNPRLSWDSDFTHYWEWPAACSEWHVTQTHVNSLSVVFSHLCWRIDWFVSFKLMGLLSLPSSLLSPFSHYIFAHLPPHTHISTHLHTPALSSFLMCQEDSKLLRVPITLLCRSVSTLYSNLRAESYPNFMAYFSKYEGLAHLFKKGFMWFFFACSRLSSWGALSPYQEFIHVSGAI